MKNPKKPTWLDEFAAFAIKGNAMSLAVGTIIGAAFSTITKSITDDIIMPIVAIFMGGQNMFDAFVPANAYANGKNLTQYDESINTAWRDAVRQYAHGEVDRDTAIENFKITVADTLGLDVD